MVADRNQKNAATNAQIADPICNHITKPMLPLLAVARPVLTTPTMLTTLTALTTSGQPDQPPPCQEIRMVLGTANLTVEMAVGSQLSATVSEEDL